MLITRLIESINTIAEPPPGGRRLGSTPRRGRENPRGVALALVAFSER
jgi:hypothetical protein